MSVPKNTPKNSTKEKVKVKKEVSLKNSEKPLIHVTGFFDARNTPIYKELQRLSKLSTDQS